MTIKYYNLSQCSGDRVVHFRSTDVEQMNYRRLLWSVPDEWFYRLHKGDGILVVDKSSNSKGKIERIFIPLLNILLNRIYFGKETENPFLLHLMKAFDEIKADKQLYTKYHFWKGEIPEDFKISAKTIKVNKETNPIKR